MRADGAYPRVRLPDAEGSRDPLGLLVIIGVRAEGTKELVAVADGYREPTESWAEVLRDLKARGMAAPVLAVGDGAVGLWNALGQVWSRTLEPRCWAHKTARVLSALPKKLLHAISYSESRTKALAAAKVFADELAGHPKAVAKVMSELDVLLTFYDFPEPHWNTCAPNQPDRGDLLDGSAANPGHQGCGQPPGCGRDGLQAAGRRPGSVAAGPRPSRAPGRAGATFIDGQLQGRSPEHDEDTDEVCAA